MSEEVTADEYEKLLNELENEVFRQVELRSGELLKWGEKRGIGVVTLALLIDDLKRRGSISVSSELEVVDEHLDISIPLSIKSKIVKPQPDDRKIKRKSRQVKKEEQGTLLKFLFKEERGEGSGETSENRVKPHSEKTSNQSSSQDTVLEKLELAQESEDFTITLQYLRRYWSVGELRLLSDLSELGVKDPAAIIRKLEEDGVIVRSELGVVNANKEIIAKLLSRLPPSARSSKNLGELFG
ncbi:MAG: hypothetical protein QXY49_05295 [Thermofilaceae archaeon]